jgi:hypothetical protein
MDFAKSFSYVFEDPDWVKKVALIAVVSLIPIVGLFVAMGWMLEVTRRVINRDPRPLPELNFGEQLGLGLKAFVVGLGYAVPILILELPIIIGSSVLTDGSDTSSTILMALSVCCGGLIFLYALLMAVMMPVAYGNVAAQNTIGAGFQFRQLIALLRANPGAYLLAILGTILGSFVASLGTIACVIGVFFTYAYFFAVQGHLYGQAYLAATQNQAYH